MGSDEEQDFVRRLEDQLRQLAVADVLAQTVVTVSQLAWQRLAADARDLAQARLAIDALRALLPVLRGAVGSDLSRDFERGVSNLQLAYAQAVAEAGSQAREPEAPGAAAAPAGDAGEPTEPTGAGEDASASGGGADAADPDRGGGDERLPGDEPPTEPVTES